MGEEDGRLTTGNPFAPFIYIAVSPSLPLLRCQTLTSLSRLCFNAPFMHRQPTVKAGSVQMNGAAVEATEDEEV